MQTVIKSQKNGNTDFESAKLQWLYDTFLEDLKDLDLPQNYALEFKILEKAIAEQRAKKSSLMAKKPRGSQSQADS